MFDRVVNMPDYFFLIQQQRVIEKIGISRKGGEFTLVGNEPVPMLIQTTIKLFRKLYGNKNQLKFLFSHFVVAPERSVKIRI